MKILIIGDGNSIYIKNYIRYVFLLSERDAKVYLCTIRIRNAEYLEFYKKNGIILIYSQIANNFSPYIPIFNSLAGFLYALYRIQQNSCYDVIHVHYASMFSCSLAYISRKFTKAEVCSFWGSDLLRAKQRNIRLLLPFLNKCEVITTETQLMHDLLLAKTRKNFNNKIKQVTFGVEGFDYIDNIKKHENKNVYKQRLGIPTDKIIVSIGYNGSPHQQHLQALEELEVLEASFLNRIFIVLQMTYGNIDSEYCAEVKKKVESIGCSYKIFNEYMTDSDISRLRCSTDIFIHAQITDSFSSSFQEYIYAGAIVMNAKWVKYDELRAIGIKYIEYSSFKEMSLYLKEILVDIDNYRMIYSNDKQVLRSFFSMDAAVIKWREIYDYLY